MNGTEEHVLKVPLSIGLVNNASDRALSTTEAQFLRMLRAASAGFELSFKLFTSPKIERSIRPLDCHGNPYRDIGNLFDTQVDALVVTGMEPQRTRLQDEPVWDHITKLVDWATNNSIPVIWSCLAAHAAVLYLDGITRTRLGDKLLGIFACDVLPSDHELVSGLPSRWYIPHSRYHTVSESALAARGYQIVSSSDEAGVDVFIRQKESTFLFFQGHPEYAADTVVRQYVRDIRRYFLHQSNEYPKVPRHIFRPTIEAELGDIRARSLRNRPGPDDLPGTLSLLSGLAINNQWEQPMVGLYANWLALIAQGRPQQPRLIPARYARSA